MSAQQTATAADFQVINHLGKCYCHTYLFISNIFLKCNFIILNYIRKSIKDVVLIMIISVLIFVTKNVLSKFIIFMNYS